MSLRDTNAVLPPKFRGELGLQGEFGSGGVRVVGLHQFAERFAAGVLIALAFARAAGDRLQVRTESMVRPAGWGAFGEDVEYLLRLIDTLETLDHCTCRAALVNRRAQSVSSIVYRNLFRCNRKVG